MKRLNENAHTEHFKSEIAIFMRKLKRIAIVLPPKFLMKRNMRVQLNHANMLTAGTGFPKNPT